ncbi:hypothetical protein FQA39_LY13429 [Lamprigera yunnana]|nr:hypothetical protein FQA39_LY13429 [Lamprigera yunnana]
MDKRGLPQQERKLKEALKKGHRAYLQYLIIDKENHEAGNIMRQKLNHRTLKSIKPANLSGCLEETMLTLTVSSDTFNEVNNDEPTQDVDPSFFLTETMNIHNTEEKEEDDEELDIVIEMESKLEPQ